MNELDTSRRFARVNDTSDRKNLGAISLDLQTKESLTRSPIELEREAQKNYLDELLIAVDRGKKLYEGDFFIRIETKFEPLMTNVHRNYFIILSCAPTPFYDQSVFQYKHKEEQLVYHWTVPCKEVCEHLRDNALFVVPEERQLLGYVLDYYSGDLLKKAQHLNGETSDLELILERKENDAT